MPILSQKSNTGFVTPEQKKQKKLIYILLGVVVVTVVVVYFGFFSGGGQQAAMPVATPDSLPGQDATGMISPGMQESGGIGTASSAQSSDTFAQKLSSLENLNLDFSIFQDAKFQSLKSFGSLPDMSGPKGRSNPFTPY